MSKFEKGQSGNPRGRPRGIANQAKLRNAIAKDIPEILKAVTMSAKEGDVGAAKLLLDRVLPALKPQDAAIRLPLGGDLAESGRAVLEAVSGAVLSPEQGGKLLQAIGGLARVLELADLEERIKRLEELNHEHA